MAAQRYAVLLGLDPVALFVEAAAAIADESGTDVSYTVNLET